MILKLLLTFFIKSVFFGFDTCLDTNCKHRRQSIVFLHERSLSVQCFDSLLALLDFRLAFQYFSPGTLNYMYTYIFANGTLWPHFL